MRRFPEIIVQIGVVQLMKGPTMLNGNKLIQLAETAPYVFRQTADVRSCQMFDGRWDKLERRDAKLPWGGSNIPDWMIEWWQVYSNSMVEQEESLAVKMRLDDGFEGYFHSTLNNCYFRDLSKGSTYSGPYCRLYAFGDRTGRLYFADTIASGQIVKGWASVKVRYRFKDLVEQAGSLGA